MDLDECDYAEFEKDPNFHPFIGTRKWVFDPTPENGLNTRQYEFTEEGIWVEV